MSAATKRSRRGARAGRDRDPRARLALIVAATSSAFRVPVAVRAAGARRARQREPQGRRTAGSCSGCACPGRLLFLELGRGGHGPQGGRAHRRAWRRDGRAPPTRASSPGSARCSSSSSWRATRSGRPSGSCSGRSGCSRAGCSSAGSGLAPLPDGGVRLGGGGRRPSARRRRALARADPALAAYGAVAGFPFGAVMNLWSWPFLAAARRSRGIRARGAAINVRHYARLLPCVVARVGHWRARRQRGAGARFSAGPCSGLSTARPGGCA